MEKNKKQGKKKQATLIRRRMGRPAIAMRGSKRLLSHDRSAASAFIPNQEPMRPVSRMPRLLANREDSIHG